LYAKDLSCPEDWRDARMDDVVPSFLSYRGDNDFSKDMLSFANVAAESLMVYVGQNNTCTPAHIDHYGAIGHNIMVSSEEDSSSFWFIVGAKDMTKFEELLESHQSTAQFENCLAPMDFLCKAEFPIYVLDQRVGDLAIVPSLSYHQVVNLGKSSTKMAWNRLTISCLDFAINNILPRYKQINNPEVYRIKSIIHRSLINWTKLL
ncbi:hypothetical protein BC939DRAFT_378360, partial [Gamsiella multidivaricata]|uniref:uncharacterized protein n=1 Tax=Gamsiella multidivaricata TaxID=101098 RepID=UPI0022207406